MLNSGPTESTVLLPPDAFSRLKLANKMCLRPGLRPDPAGGAYSAPSDPLARLKGPVSKGRGWGWDERGGKGGEKGKGKGKGRGGYEGEGECLTSPGG